MNQDAKLDKLVLEYLEKRGLAATSRQLKAECQSLSQQMSLAPSRGSNGVVSDLLFYLAAEGKPANYARGFDSLASWVDNSLDMYRYELSLVLYPVFIHCCLQLVKNDAAGEATQLIGRHSSRFTNAGGQRSKVRLQEISELQAVTMPEHLATNRIAQAVTNTRYPVSLCRHAYQLLMHFLEAAHLSLVLGVINDHISLKVEERMPIDLPDAAKAETSLLSGDMEAGGAGAKLSEINLSLLQGMAEDKFLSARAAEQAEDIPEVDESGRQLTKKERQARLRAAAKERDAVAAAQANRMEPEIPLPKLTEEALEARMADIRARADVSAEALPSAAFFTFVNTQQSLHCAAFNESGSHIAGGFGGANIRVFDMEKAGAATGNEPGEEVLELSGHSGAVYGLDFSPAADLLFSASGDGTLRLWHLPLAACLNSYRGHNFPVWDVKASPFGHYFASAGADRSARLWSIERNQPLRVFTGHYSDVDVVAWHPNAHFLATGSTDHTIRLWDVKQGQVQRMLVGHRAAITSLAFHPGGEVMASADEDGVIICWDLGTAKRLSAAEKHSEPVWSLAYSRGLGALLASGGADDSLKLWDAATPATGDNAELRLLKSFRTKATPVYCTMFTPRNLLLGCGALSLARKPTK